MNEKRKKQEKDQQDIPWQGVPMDAPTDILEFPGTYLPWCWNNKELQHHWQTRWSDRQGIIHSNINVGDRFSLGEWTQFGFVYRKITFVSIEHPTTFLYRIGGDIGGHWFEPRHERLADGYFRWIPTIEQLLLLGFQDMATELQRFYQERQKQFQTIRPRHSQ